MESPGDNELFAKSPVRSCRVALGYTLLDISKRAGVNYQTWYLTERGCYARIPHAIAEFLVNTFGYSEVWLDRRYDEFVTAVRERFREEFSYDYAALAGCGTLEDVYETLGVSRTQFAKLLAVQPAVLYKFSQGRQRELPGQLLQAFAEAGVPVELTLNLQKGVKRGS